MNSIHGTLGNAQRCVEVEHICDLNESTNRSSYLSVPWQCNAGGTDKWDNAVSYE